MKPTPQEAYDIVSELVENSKYNAVCERIPQPDEEVYDPNPEPQKWHVTVRGVWIEAISDFPIDQLRNLSKQTYGVSLETVPDILGPINVADWKVYGPNLHYIDPDVYWELIFVER